MVPSDGISVGSRALHDSIPHFCIGSFIYVELRDGKYLGTATKCWYCCRCLKQKVVGADGKEDIVRVTAIQKGQTPTRNILRTN